MEVIMGDDVCYGFVDDLITMFKELIDDESIDEEDKDEFYETIKQLKAMSNKGEDHIIKCSRCLMGGYQLNRMIEEE